MALRSGTEIAARIEAEARREVARFRRAARGLVPRTCPNCGYVGPFTAYGQPPRYDARCGNCRSLERHRLIRLFLDRTGFLEGHHAVLHLAPEAQIGPYAEALVAHYETADLSERRSVTHRVDVADTGLPSESYDRILCSHVLEHVDDRAALAELCRLLVPGGRVLIAAPVCEGWAVTHENPNVVAPADRRVQFGQADHLRLYGRDIRERIRTAGFELDEYVAVEPDVLTYGLMRGETLFIGTRPL